MPVSSSTFAVFFVSWPIWLVVVAGLVFFRVCRWVYEFYRRSKRAF